MEEWEKLRNEISRFPWGVENGDTVEDAEYLTNAEGNIINSCFDSFDKKADRQFVLDAPKNYDLVMQALKEAVEVIKVLRIVELKRIADDHTWRPYEWLRKYGWKEEFTVADIPVKLDPTLKEGEWRIDDPKKEGRVELLINGNRIELSNYLKEQFLEIVQFSGQNGQTS